MSLALIQRKAVIVDTRCTSMSLVYIFIVLLFLFSLLSDATSLEPSSVSTYT